MGDTMLLSRLRGHTGAAVHERLGRNSATRTDRTVRECGILRAHRTRRFTKKRPPIGGRFFDESADRVHDAGAALHGARLEPSHDGGPGRPSNWTTETTSNPAATAIRP